MSEPIRIAMWSGPRNISTAMMRSFENRRDTTVVDEPFYAAYLAAAGVVHPMQAEVLASLPKDWRDVVKTLLGSVADGRPLFNTTAATRLLAHNSPCGQSQKTAETLRPPSFIY